MDVAGLLERYGRQITIHRPSRSGRGFDPIVSYSTLPAQAVIMVAMADQFPETVIQLGDRELITDSEIFIDDKIIDEDVEYSMVSIEKVKPGTVTYAYIALIRRVG